MIQAVIYARYSTEKQNPKSIDDQISLCKEFAENYEKKVSVVKVFYDKAQSGKKTERNGLDTLVNFVISHPIDWVLVESLDRLSRNASHSHSLYDIFKHYDVTIISPNEGKINKLFLGIKSTMNSIYLEETAQKVTRSHKQLAKQGFVPGGLAYGYKVKRDAVDENGKHRNGVREIVPEKAEVVKRIFEMYADGAGSKAIAERLNLEGIPSPSEKYWVPSTILGTRSRSSGILCNRIYKGLIVWNRVKKRINPLTNKYQHTINPEADQVTTPAEALRIIDDDLWNRVQVRYLQASLPIKNRKSYSQNSLSGMVYCGVCGSRCHRANETRYVCGAYRIYRTCKNARGVKSEILIKKLYENLDAYIKETNFQNEFNAIFAEEKKKQQLHQAKLEEIDKNIEHFVAVIEQGINLDAITKKLKALQIQRAKILDIIQKNTPAIHNNKTISRQLQKALCDMQDDDQKESFAPSWRKSMSLIVDQIITTPIPDKKRGMTVDVKIAPMKGWAEFYQRITATKAHK